MLGASFKLRNEYLGGRFVINKHNRMSTNNRLFAVYNVEYWKILEKLQISATEQHFLK